jgi:poly-gamma-glutamate synthesis protein (capsule biosynthesis protein)
MSTQGFKIAAMGDVMLDRSVGRQFAANPDVFRLGELAGLTQGCELVFANLENPVGIRGTPHPIQDPNVTFCAHPRTLQVLKNLNVNVVSLGNNHMLDYGPGTLGETLEYLDEQGIKHVGAGKNYEEANQPLLLELNGNKVAVLSYVFLYSASTEMATRTKAGVSDHRIQNILPRVRELSRIGYKVIVSAHWGAEYSFYPLPYQMAQARQIIDSGALMVIGHGPHFPQGIENYRDGKIVYSLGNFIFDEPYLYANRSFLYRVDVVAGKLVGERLYPVHLVENVPRLVEGKAQQAMLRLVDKLGRIYPRRSKRFWQKQNALYFRDIVHRVHYMKSLKFVTLPPLSFYFGIGARNYLRKLLPRHLKELVRE